MKTPNLPDPDSMRADERVAEIATILATGLLRMCMAENEKYPLMPQDSSVRLGFLPDQRVHTTPYQEEKL